MYGHWGYVLVVETFRISIDVHFGGIMDQVVQFSASDLGNLLC